MIERLQKEKMSLISDTGESYKEQRLETIDKKLATALQDLNKANYEKEINSLKSMKNKKGNSAAIHKLKQKVLGPKEPTLDAVAVEDPESGILITEPEKINEMTLQYCLDLLKDRKPKPEFEAAYNEKLELKIQSLEV